MIELSSPECWKLLASVPVGRVVFSQRAMPAVRVVNHLVDGQLVVIRSHQGAAITGGAGTGDGAVVCYEADDLDPARRTGWSVVVTGLARLVRDTGAAERYSRLLHSWDPADMDQVIIIEPGTITGRRLVG
ncbi:MAG: pyridoxamine 5'-phosphate oxidase family protein [Nocardiopsaceae bacterium]|nr:pyridoxamine 5'-phosphate oxidase family protein [Nocardiopsaceae bacterium]